MIKTYLLYETLNRSRMSISSFKLFRNRYSVNRGIWVIYKDRFSFRYSEDYPYKIYMGKNLLSFILYLNRFFSVQLRPIIQSLSKNKQVLGVL